MPRLRTASFTLLRATSPIPGPSRSPMATRSIYNRAPVSLPLAQQAEIRTGLAIGICDARDAQVIKLAREDPAVWATEAGYLLVQPRDLREVPRRTWSLRPSKTAVGVTSTGCASGWSVGLGNRKQSPALVSRCRGTATAPPVEGLGVTICSTGPPGLRSNRENAPRNKGLSRKTATLCSPICLMCTTEAVPARGVADCCPSQSASNRWLRRAISTPSCSYCSSS